MRLSWSVTSTVLSWDVGIRGQVSSLLSSPSQPHPDQEVIGDCGVVSLCLNEAFLPRLR